MTNFTILFSTTILYVIVEKSVKESSPRIIEGCHIGWPQGTWVKAPSMVGPQPLGIQN